jgi:hypothetical protein
VSRNVTLLFLAVILSGFSTSLLGINYSDAYRYLMQRYGTTPAAGESPEQFRQRVAAAEARESYIRALAEAKSQLADVKARIIRLEVQIKTGSCIPEDGGSAVTSLTEEDKAEMVRELVKLEETKAWLESQCQRFSDAIAKDDSRIARENQRREIDNALSRQTEKIRQEIEEEMSRRRR